MSSFSYAVPNARRTDRLSETFVNRFPTSISTASSSCSRPGHVAPAPPTSWIESLPPGAAAVEAQ
jgi:hypothetical protein